MGELRRSSETRQVELIDAALRIIETRGIAALSTRSLAEAVGLSSGAMFRHFATIDDLLDAVVSRVEAVLEATYPTTSLPPLERLERFVEARSTVVGSQLGIPRLVLSEQFSLALPKRGSERLAACRKKTHAFITECLRDGQRAGEVRTDVDVDVLAPIVIGTVQMLVLSRTSRRALEAQRVRSGLLTLLRPIVRKQLRKRTSS
jgi:AcrR family transcriptional regulator